MPRVMVVDDEVQVARALKRLLQRNGFEVSVAESGEQALAQLDAFAPDVVLSDFRMGGMTGAELLAQVKRRLPFALRIIISGYADLNSVVTSVNEGEICRFISKPWDDDVLVGKLRALLAEREAGLTLGRALDSGRALTSTAFVHQERSVVVRVTRDTSFTPARALSVIGQFAEVLEQTQVNVVAGLLESHGGRVSFFAEFGGAETLSVELPVRVLSPAAPGEKPL